MSPKHSLLAAAFLMLATTHVQPAEAMTFVSPAGYQISTPDGWVTRAAPGAAAAATIFYCALGKNGQPTLPGVDVLARPIGAMTMKNLVAYAPGMVAGTFPGFHQPSAVRTSLGGSPAYEIRGTYPRRNRIVCIRELFAAHNGEAYIITTGFPMQQRAAYEAVSNQVIASLRWR